YPAWQCPPAAQSLTSQSGTVIHRSARSSEAVWRNAHHPTPPATDRREGLIAWSFSVHLADGLADLFRFRVQALAQLLLDSFGGLDLLRLESGPKEGF